MTSDDPSDCINKLLCDNKEDFQSGRQIITEGGDYYNANIIFGGGDTGSENMQRDTWYV